MKSCLIQGSKSSEYPSLPEEAFILAIQTKFQLELYKQHASTILCIDSTHGTNQYRFKLITIAVPDELRKGQCVHVVCVSVCECVCVCVCVCVRVCAYIYQNMCND